MSKAIKKTVNTFIKRHHITTVNYSTLKEVVKNIGFTLIDFNNIFNDKDVETVILNLGLSETVLRSRGFTYADNNYRLVFINEDLCDDEKMYVLSHELGHIICEHYTTAPVIGNDVKEEHEANEFSHYLLKNNLLRNLKIAISEHRRRVFIGTSVLFVILALIVAGLVVNKEKSYYGDFYITTTGEKYHQAECIHVKNNNNVERLTEEQFESEEYEPCGICLPQG